MSFDDWGAAGSRRSAAAPRTPAKDSDLRQPLLQGKEASPLERIGANYSRLLNNITDMKSDISKIGTPQDSEEVRSHLKTVRTETQELVKNTRSLMAMPYERQDRARYDLLSSQFNALESELQRVYAEAVRKEKIFLEKKQEAMSYRKSVRAQTISNGGGDMKLQELRDADDIDSRIIAERNKEIQDVEQDLKELVTVFKEVKQIVGEQGQDINKIEQNTVTADMNVAEGAKQLEEGEKLQNSARKKKIIIAVIVVVALIIVGVLIFVIVKFVVR
jgi:syntaxin 7